MKKLLILALTSAFVAAANAAGDWFSVSVAVGGSTQTTTGASWSTTPAVADGVISIDEDVDTALSLTPDALSPDAQTNTVVTVEATFTAVSDADSLESPGADAKTALTVAKDGDNDYYYYWDGDSWEKITTVSPTLNTSVTVMIELDNTSMTGTTATIKVGGTTVATVANASTKTKVSGLAFAGTGKIGNINADYTKAYASYNNTYYATVADAVNAAGGGAVTLYKHGGSFGTMPTDPNKLYFPASVNNDTASLYTFNKVGDDYQITSADDLKALVDLTAYDNTALALNFKQTDNIALDAAWPGIGIQNGKDIVSDTAFDNGAFTGTYDGGNYTISNFQMVDGLDYCGFFNSVKGATIKNLKISYKDGSFAKDMVAANNACGATFVGVAKASTLTNLTSLAGTVSCTKGFGGIVGYLMAGSTVDSCTNNVNLTSTASNKCGGIAMITQSGTGTATIRNCQNNGTTAGDANQKGGIVGYVGVATTIDGCSDTAGSGPSILHNHGQTVTISGVITAPTNVVAYTTSNNDPIDGLDFAIVDANGIATFVKAANLAAGNTYKVMGPKATATYQFTAAGTIAFDTALATPTYVITAETGLALTDSTEGTVKTYTAVQTFTITWKSDANTTIDTTTVNYGVVPSHEDPTKVGYEFTGWDSEIVAATADATYTATWEQTSTPVVSEAVTTLVAVPANCKAAELIDLSNREEGDVLKVYSKDDSDKCYYTWTLSGEKEWTPATTYKVSEASATSHEKAASAVQLYAGQAAWLTRVNPNEAITLAVVAQSDTINVNVDNGWNMIAPLPKGNESTVALNAVVSAGAAGDEIKIPTAGAPITCTYDSKTEKWGYWSFTKDANGRITGKTWVSTVTIPAGTGLWYINGGDSKSVELK